MATATIQAVMDTVDEHWAHYDEDESEELSRNEFQSFVQDVLEAHNLVLVERNFRKTFRDYDEDGSGTIKREEADEFLKHMWISACIAAVWENLEKEEDDALSKRQFRVFARDCLEAMGYDPDGRVSELNDLMEEYDADGDGEMDQDEAFDLIDEFVGSRLDEEE